MSLCRTALGKRSKFRMIVVTSVILTLSLTLVPLAEVSEDIFASLSVRRPHMLPTGRVCCPSEVWSIIAGKTGDVINP